MIGNLFQRLYTIIVCHEKVSLKVERPIFKFENTYVASLKLTPWKLVSGAYL